MRHISAVGTGGYTLVLILGAFCGFITGAYLADGIGRKSTFMLSAILSIVLTMAYLFALESLTTGSCRLALCCKMRGH